VCEEITNEVRRLVSALPPVGDRHLFHGDPHTYNMLKRDGHIVGVIDWEQAGIGDHMYDLAVADLWDDIEDPARSFRVQAAEHYASAHRELPDFAQRLRLYGLLYCLEVLEIFARNSNRAKYDAMRHRMMKKKLL
jgi:aminoglycoside phosphotransferase (APT) family kinase protein